MFKKITYGACACFRFMGRYDRWEYSLKDVIPADDSPWWDTFVEKIFIAIPKTGSQSIEYSISTKNCFGHMFASQFPSKMVNLLVTIVRNPYDRLVSSYEFICRGGFNNNPNYLKIRDNYKNFEDWVLHGLKSQQFAIPRNMCYSMEEGWKDAILPQYYWLTNEHNKLILPKENIGRFENLTADVKRLLNIDLTLHYNRSPNKKHLHTYYSNPEVAKKVYQLYRRDFILFEYSEEVPSI